MVELGKTGEQVSQVSLGCMLMGSTIDAATSYAMLDCFVEDGGTFLDTANCYAWWVGKGEFVGDESEMLLGAWMQARGNRDDLFLATKTGARLTNPAGIRNAQGEVEWERVSGEYQGLAPDTIRRSVEDSLRRLRTDRIDLYYAHIDDRDTALDDTLDALNRLVEQGKVRFIGCSNYRTWRIERARAISAAHGWAHYVAAQQEYSYLRPKPGADFGVGAHVDGEMLDYFRANDEIALVAYSPLLKGIYDDAEKRARYYNWSLYDSDDSRARLEVLGKMAGALGVSNSQLVLAWLLHHQPQVIPIFGMSSKAQYEHNMAALNITLDDAQMAELNAASA
ncbi:aldo/keto reductase [Aggregatilinea lenta]|uniref:aldo/keto reductase n=1 Tax=Aggregatilinea lenta TaxID=913108 RepID=UPI001EE80E1D|nr:aldo/keto reductase [Aggregatilinea lenta]